MPKSPIRVLIVEDSPTDAKLLEHELRKGGLDFTSARVDTEPDFISALLTEPDIVLCDWQMPDFDSLRALALLQEKCPDTPLVLVSGSIGEEAAVKMIKLGASDYVLKDRRGRLPLAVQQALSTRDLQKSARLTQVALQRSKHQLAEAQRVARLGSWVWEPLSGNVSWSDAMFTVLGLDKMTAQPSLETFLSVLHLDDRPTAVARVSALIDGADEFANDFRIVRPNGTCDWIHSRAQATRDELGRVVLVEGTDQDITDRKMREAELQYQHAILRSQSEASPDGILVVGPDARVLSWNRRFLEVWGIPLKLLEAGDDLPILALVQAKVADSASFSARVATIYADPELHSRDELALADGRTLERYSSPIHSVDRKLLGRVWYFRDITERKRLETQFLQAQKMEAVGRLAGGVAYDFNNLLTVINGYGELLMTTDLPAGDRRRESVAVILDAGERAARLTQQLLAFSRKAVVETKVVDLNEIVSESAKLLRRLIGEDVVLAVVTDPMPIWVKADPGQLEQVVMNLVVNARDAMPRGGRLTIETTTVASEEGNQMRFASLSVIDTGHGMTEEVKNKIFEPFFTTKGVGKGTGLGLAVVHGVVTQSGGRIVVESDLGVGTTFRLLLPLVTDEVSRPAAGSALLATHGTETVLLVEDEDAVRTIARISLETQGYTVLEADSGTEAVRLAETHMGEIHILLSDVVMPEMGGRQLLEKVRKLRPGVQVLFMSGYTDDAVLLQGVIKATDAFIQKPFSPLSLARKVRMLINASAS